MPVSSLHWGPQEGSYGVPLIPPPCLPWFLWILSASSPHLPPKAGCPAVVRCHAVHLGSTFVPVHRLFLGTEVMPTARPAPNISWRHAEPPPPLW